MKLTVSYGISSLLLKKSGHFTPHREILQKTEVCGTGFRLPPPKKNPGNLKGMMMAIKQNDSESPCRRRRARDAKEQIRD